MYGSSPPQNLSFYGGQVSSAIVLRNKGLKSADIILLIASAVTGACGELHTLDVSDNQISDIGLTHLEKVLILNGEKRILPSLYTVDLSNNADTTQGMRQRVLDARRGPMGESTDVVFALSPSHQFRIEPKDNRNY